MCGWRQVRDLAFRTHGRRVRFQPRVDSSFGLFSVTGCEYVYVTIETDRNIEINGTTTHFAILYVILLHDRVVDQDTDALATIGTMNRAFFHGLTVCTGL